MIVGVIGAGISGLTAALKLSQNGHKILLFEGQHIASGVTSGTAGQIVASFVNVRSKFDAAAVNGTPFEAESRLLRRRLDRAIESWRSLLKRSALDKHLILNGSVHAYPEESQVMHDDMEQRKDAGIRMHIVSKNNLKVFSPILSKRYNVGVYYPDNGQIFDVNLLCEDIFYILLASGSEFINHQVDFIDDVGHGVYIRSGGKEFFVDRCVVASGQFNEIFPRIRDVNICDFLIGEDGYRWQVSRDVAPSCPILFQSEQITLAEQGNKTYIYGSDNFPSHAEEFCDVNNIKLIENWQKWSRPSTVDGYPRLRTLTKRENVIGTMGHGHVGVTIAAILAADIAMMIDC